MPDKLEEEKDVVTSGIESEIMGTTDSEPPKKIYISEDGNGEKILHCKSPKHKTDFVHKIRSPKHTTAQIFRVSGPNEKGKIWQILMNNQRFKFVCYHICAARSESLNM